MDMDMEMENSTSSSSSIINISNSNAMICNHFNNNDGDHNDNDNNGHVDDDGGEDYIEIINEKEYSSTTIKDFQQHQVQLEQDQQEEEEVTAVGLELEVLENNNVNVTMNIYKFDEDAEAELSTESRIEGITSQCYEGNLSIFSGETVMFDQTPNYNEEQEEDDDNDEEMCSVDSNSLHDDTVQRLVRAKKEIMDAFHVIKDQYDVIADFRKQENDEIEEMNAELEEGLRELENESDKQKDLQVKVEAMRTKLAQKNPTTSEAQRIEAEYKKIKESHERAVKSLQDENDLSENLKLFYKTYGINLGLVADDSSLKAIILQNLDPNDETRPFYIYFDKLNPNGFNAFKIYPDFPNSQELLRKSNEDQDFMYLLIKIKEFWIESCTKQS